MAGVAALGALGCADPARCRASAASSLRYGALAALAHRRLAAASTRRARTRARSCATARSPPRGASVLLTTIGRGQRAAAPPAPRRQHDAPPPPSRRRRRAARPPAARHAADARRAGTYAAMTARTLLLGDWHRWMRDPIDVLRLCSWPARRASRSPVTATGADPRRSPAPSRWAVRPLNLPRVVRPRARRSRSRCRPGARRSGSTTRSPGSTRSCTSRSRSSARRCSTSSLARLDVVPDPRDETTTQPLRRDLHRHLRARRGASAALWELVEWISDGLFGSRAAGRQRRHGRRPARRLRGRALRRRLLVCWARYAWGSVRRIPGENRYEDVHAS